MRLEKIVLSFYLVDIHVDIDFWVVIDAHRSISSLGQVC